MNKRRVDDWIAPAMLALAETGIAEAGKVDSKFRGQISSFGAAVVMGSLKAAAAFFAKQGSAAVPRERLLSAMYFVISGGENQEPAKVFSYICENDTVETREKFIDAAIALKLAMNLYDMGKGDAKNEKSEPAVQ